MKRATVIVAGLIAACAWVGTGSSASAQAAEPSPTPQPSAQATPAAYEFIAQPGNSMSVMARKAVQLYDQKTEDVALPEPCIIAAETHIVQTLGPRWLEVGENLKIDEALVAEQARWANGLTEQQKDAWIKYSSGVDFTLADVKLASEVRAAQPGSTEGQADPNQQSNSGEATPDSEAQANGEQQSDTNPGTTNGNAPWYWWVVGAGTIGALYYLLGGRGKSAEEE